MNTLKTKGHIEEVEFLKSSLFKIILLQWLTGILSQKSLRTTEDLLATLTSFNFEKQRMIFLWKILHKAKSRLLHIKLKVWYR